MSKCAARIQIGWFNNVFEAEDPCGILKKVEEIQDFDCLIEMGRIEEGVKGQKELDRLEVFVGKYRDGSLTMEDIKNLNIKLRIGDIICQGIAESEEEISKL